MNVTAFVPLQIVKYVEHIGGWHTPTSLDSSLGLAWSKKLHTKLEPDLILLLFNSFWHHNPKCTKEHKNTWFNDKNMINIMLNVSK